MTSLRECCKIKCCKPEQPKFNIECENLGQDIEFIELSEFLPRVSYLTRGVPNEILIEWLRQSCQNIAKTTGLLKRSFRFKTQSHVRDYYIDQGDSEQIHRIDKIEHRKIDIPTSHVFECNGYIFWNATVYITSYACNTFEFFPPNKVILGNKPTRDGDSCIDVHFTAEPTQSACKVDRLLFDKYHELVVFGALKELYLADGYGWYNPVLAQAYTSKYNANLARAKMDVASGFTRGKSFLKRVSF